MNDTFGNVEQRKPVFQEESFNRSIRSVDELPSATDVDVGTCCLLLKDQTGYTPGVIYIVREIDGVPAWVDISQTEDGFLTWAAPRFWKRLTPDAIVLHWDDPPQTSGSGWHMATWDHDVIVRKRGSAPESLNDGEIVGYSSVYNQYRTGTKGFVHPLFSDDTDYFYRIFAVTVSGKVTPSATSMRSSWTWDEIHETINDTSIDPKMHHLCFRIGDIFELPSNLCLGGRKLHAQIVDFDYSVALDHMGEPYHPNSITFLTTEVLGSMTFSNKELKYALTSDVAFVADKKYFLDNGGPEPEEFDWIEAGYKPNMKIPEMIEGKPLASVLLELQPSWRYFRNIATPGITDAAKDAQVVTVAGNSNWNASNIRSWLNLNPHDLDPLKYLTNTDPVYYWYMEETDPVLWKNATNGWFTAPFGSFHQLAPASIYSGSYINLPPFISGFTTEEGQRFVEYILPAYQFTLTDQYVYRYTRNPLESDLKTDQIVGKNTDHVGALTSTDLFWLPSFEEIYGRKAGYGVNGGIAVSDTKDTHEGSQFAYFKNNKNWKNCRLKYNLDGELSGWYLRTCDPTTVSHVFYVPSDLPDRDTKTTLVDISCPAHRYLLPIDEKITVGPAVCFTLI